MTMNVNNMERNYANKLTVELLNWLPPMRVMQFSEGIEAIEEWAAQNENYDITYCYRKNSTRPHMVYYNVK